MAPAVSVPHNALYWLLTEGMKEEPPIRSHHSGASLCLQASVRGEQRSGEKVNRHFSIFSPQKQLPSFGVEHARHGVFEAKGIQE